VRAVQVLHRELKGHLGFLHAKTLAAFWRGVEGVPNADRLWLTALGRGLAGACADKHRIKAADRLLGNERLHRALIEIYRVLASYLVARIQRPCVLVDWTGAGPDHHVITASLSFQGRSLPIFSRVYADKQKGSPKAQREFLQHLADVIPPNCKPIIITDAAFYFEWFEQVLALGWDFIGRLRGTTHIRVSNTWIPLTTLHRMAGRGPRDLGVVPVGRLRPRDLRVVLASKRRSKNRQSLTLKGIPRRDTNSRRSSKAAREPWVLATSVQCSARKVVVRYALRMQLEECFRDLKAHRHGWSLDYVRSKTHQRIEILLLVAAVALVAMHALGIAMERAKIHFGYQANTVRNKRVLSTFFLARLVIRNGDAQQFQANQVELALVKLRDVLQQASEPA